VRKEKTTKGANMSEMVAIGGLWRQTSKKSGAEFWSGSLDTKAVKAIIDAGKNSPADKVRLMIFKNERMEKSRDPAYRMMIAPDTYQAKKQPPPDHQEPQKDEPWQPRDEDNTPF
jgi:hypothetical protein